MSKSCDKCRHWAGFGSTGSLWSGGCSWKPPKPWSAVVRRIVYDEPLGCDLHDAERCDVYQERKEAKSQ